MKNLKEILLILLLTTSISSPVWAHNESLQDSERKIILFKSELNSIQVDNILKKHGALKIKDLPLVNGVVVTVPKNSGKELKDDKLISRIENDYIIEAAVKKSPEPIPVQPIQTIPWGISKIEADKTLSLTTADAVKVGILDSGIDISHPDLINNIKGGFNTIKHSASFNDDNGHGTHVAGIIAATNNSIGVIGVAPQVDLYAIKVLDSNGNGYTSDLIEGINWSIINKIQVVNMSLSIVSDSQALHDAIIKANQAGIVQVAAAGNSSTSPVGYPAAYPEVISVSSTNENNELSTFSSTGKVDIAAPGSNIYSTFKGSTYLTLSGTSMSTPHISGTAALLLSIPSKVDFNGDGKITPEEVKQRMQLTATDLGAIGMDSQFGAGLVNAYSAITK